MLTGERRDDIAEILNTIARDGLPGPRDLDVALDAIGSCVMSGYGDGMVWRDVTNLEAQEREWKARIAALELALRGIESTLTDEIDIQENPGVMRACKIAEDALVDNLEDAKPYTPCHLTEIG